MSLDRILVIGDTVEIQMLDRVAQSFGNGCYFQNTKGWEYAIIDKER